jgi:hypothetical protein
MSTPSPELCNPSARFSVDDRFVNACRLVVSVVRRAKLVSCAAVAVALLILLGATSGAATAQPQRGAPEVTASGFAAATLPPIETIDAQTNITVFLKKGVPDELRNAALRRAWTADPAIRNFKGPQENDWNFNDPDGVPGFGELRPEVDVKRMVAKILGEAPRLVLARRGDEAN